MSYCRRSIMGNQNDMGTQAVRSHAKTKKHFAQVKSFEKQS